MQMPKTIQIKNGEKVSPTFSAQEYANRQAKLRVYMAQNNNIKPSEISQVLLQQLKDIDTSLRFEEIGKVLQALFSRRKVHANGLHRITIQHGKEENL